MSEEILIRHCAPTLTGIKTGNIFSCLYETKSAMTADIRRFNRRLVPKGIRVLPLRYTEKQALIYVYRPAALASDLSASEARTLLAKAGYQGQTANRNVIELIRRFHTKSDFPHEIGLFLSYPPEDVLGFIENKGRFCKCLGCWKVYGDAEKARVTFDKYRHCTESCFSQWAKGTAVERLTMPT